ncbi:DUF2147 domain-containing protein [Shimia sp. SDUM112013]|uniref:DUF2147 domain-containing protein n=1 Tax=Shimia sp. SDUM112013 TaxID=3136160 RepID=UPI0032ECFBD6
MKKLILAGAVLIAGATVAAADPAAGVWKTAPGDTGGYLHVTIAPCGSAICGTIKEAYDKNGNVSPNYEHKGKKMLWDMKAEGNGAYGGGKIWAPDSDKTYKSKMSLSGSKLNVKGCVAGGMICRGQDWTRIQ